MRGKRAKELRKFASASSTDTPWVGYTTVVTGQEWKARQGIKPNETRVLYDCNRAYYQLLKRIWKAA